jgi:hypothetical protein
VFSKDFAARSTEGYGEEPETEPAHKSDNGEPGPDDPGQESAVDVDDDPADDRKSPRAGRKPRKADNENRKAKAGSRLAWIHRAGEPVPSEFKRRMTS